MKAPRRTRTVLRVVRGTRIKYSESRQDPEGTPGGSQSPGNPQGKAYLPPLVKDLMSCGVPRSRAEAIHRRILTVAASNVPDDRLDVMLSKILRRAS